MTLVFPSIPFDGTDSFESAYRALAQSIWNDFQNLEVDIDRWSAPYKNPDFMKEFLQHGLIYSSFIIQQRSGGGVGQDFDLGNSPVLVVLQKDKYLPLLGCSFTVGCMQTAFDTQVRKNPKKYKEILELIENDPEIFNKLIQAIADDNAFSYFYQLLNLGTPRNQIHSIMLLGYQAVLNILIPIIGGGDVPQPLVGHKLAGNFLSHYLGGTGTPITESNLTPGDLSSLQTNIQQFLSDAAGKSYIGADGTSIPYVRDITNSTYTTEYGLNSTDRVLAVNFKYAVPQSPINTTSNIGLHVTFGRAFVVVDANNTVKNVIDDYDWYMGWEVDRRNGSVPGQEISDDMIVAGHGRRETTNTIYDENGNLGPLRSITTTAEEAIFQTHPIDRFMVFTVSGAYGDGTYERFSDHPATNWHETGRPFPVNISFN